MTKEQLFKPFVALATKWNHNAFFAARAKLTAIYAATAAVLLGVFSYLLYGSLLVKFHELIEEQVPDQLIQQVVLDRAAEVLQARILFADGIVLAAVIILGYILTEITLRPIRQALERERRFIADAAHELRTPLTAMKTEMEVALRDKEGAGAPVKKVLTSAIEEIDSLAGIANGLIEVARGRTKTEARTPVQLMEIVRDVSAKLRPLMTAKHLSLVENLNSEPMTVVAERTALSGAIYNVLHNAVLYTQKGGTITVSTARRKTSCEIVIQDTGIGIAPTDLPHVFEPFYRADAAHSGSGGAGLGLAIVKETIERHGGNVAIESASGQGTRVTVTLPLS